MVLAETAKNFPQRQAGPRCGVGFILSGLDDADRVLLTEWLRMDSGKTARWIADVLAADGHKTAYGRPPTDQVVTHHRNGGCSCDR